MSLTNALFGQTDLDQFTKQSCNFITVFDKFIFSIQ